MGVFRSVNKDQQDMCVCQPSDQIVQKFFRALIDPVKVLNSKNKWSVLTLSNEQVTNGLKDPHPLLLRLDFEIGYILDLER